MSRQVIWRPALASAFSVSIASLGCAGRATVECIPRGTPAVARSMPADTGARVWRFDGPADASPAGFDLGHTGGPAGVWRIRSRADAPSVPAVLVQEDSSRESSRFLTAVASGMLWRDGSVSVQCAALSGGIDRACGVVWRFQDEHNYYVARANALENNVRLYYVQDGSRHEIAGWNGPVASCVWHSLRADMRGDQIDVFWNGQHVIGARDSRFAQAGRVGLWVKADSRTAFDDLTMRILP